VLILRRDRVRYRVLVTTRNAVRAGVVGAVTGLSLVAASPAFAVFHDDGEEPGDPLSPLMTLLIFVVVPIGLFLIISLLASLPSIMGGPRYRPGQGWRATPEWYGGPEAEPPPAGGPVPEGGKAPAVTSGREGDAAGESNDGGASARW
jgi:hypothetical protein